VRACRVQRELELAFFLTGHVTDVDSRRARRALLLVDSWEVKSMDAPLGPGIAHAASLCLGDERAHGANARQDDEEQLVEEADTEA
jgi:hypothetical protein